jgi:hypothetical protein
VKLKPLEFISMTIYEALGGSVMQSCRRMAGSLRMAAQTREPTKEVQIRCRGNDIGVDVDEHDALLRRKAAEKLNFLYGILVIMVAQAAVVALFRSECEVHAKPYGGLTVVSMRTKGIQLVRVSVVKLAVFSRLSITHRYIGVLPVDALRSM